jgi:hypothetical protein
LRANATAVKGAGTNAAVAVAITVDGAGLTFVEKGGWIEDSLEVSVRANDLTRKIRGSEHFDVNVRIRPESRPIMNQTGFRVISKIELPPGRYSLHIGVREAGSSRVGTVFTDFEVPEFTTPQLAMSSVVLTSVKTGGLPTGRAEQLEDRLPILPSTIRVFRPADELLAFAEIYDRREGTPHTVDLTASILGDDRSKPIVRQLERRSSAELTANAGRFNFGARFLLKDLTPGVYSLRFEAASSLDANAKVAREVPFRIEAEP